MRIKFSTDQYYLKALDIDLKLESPSRKKVASILRSISDAIRKESGVSAPSSMEVLIPDNAEVQKYKLSDDKEKQKEIKNIIKNSNREDVFVAMSNDDEILSIIKDYEIIHGSDKRDEEKEDYYMFGNIPRVLKNSNYILHFKLSEVEERISMPEKRKESRKGSKEYERKQYKESQQKELKDLFSQFMDKLKYISRKGEITDLNPKDSLPPGEWRETLLREMHNNDIFRQQDSFYQISGDPMVLESGEVSVDIYNLDRSFKKQGRSEHYDLSNDVTFELFIPSEIKEDKEDEDDFILEEVMSNDVDWWKLITTGQSFPTNLFPRNRDSRDLSRVWNQMLKITKGTSREEEEQQSTSAFKKQIQREDYRTSSNNFKYRDKSGYVVNLAKHFPKMFELSRKAHKTVIAAYKKLYTKVEEMTEKVVEKTMEAASNKDWGKVKTLSTFLESNSLTQLNIGLEFLTKDKSYEKDPSLNKGKAIKDINDWERDFEDQYDRIKIYLEDNPNEYED